MVVMAWLVALPGGFVPFHLYDNRVNQALAVDFEDSARF
jgi:hypothetical protein